MHLTSKLKFKIDQDLGQDLERRAHPPASLRMGQILHPAISPKQKRNRSRIIFGSWSSGIGTKPNVL